MNHIVNISDFKSDLDLITKKTHDGSDPLIRIINAIGMIYFPPCIPSLDIWSPEDWDTLFLYGHIRLDPKYVGIDECELDDTLKDIVFKKRSKDAGMKAVIEFFDYVKDGMLQCNYHLKQPPRGFIGKHTIITKEKISSHSSIIGFYHLKDGKYERYLIKDTRIPRKYKKQPEIVKDYIEDASSIPIKNKYIKEMLHYFDANRSNTTKVVSIF